MVMEFQVKGENSWAQCRCHVVKIGVDAVQMVSLGMPNMDGVLNGGCAKVNLPPLERRR